MKTTHTDPASEFAFDTASFADLRYLTSTRIGDAKGKFREPCNAVLTRLGNIEESVWCQMVEQLIDRAGEQALLDALTSWGKTHNAFACAADTLRKSALRAHSRRQFDDVRWVDYLAFNKKHRPEVYAQADIAIVESACCDISAEVTWEQLRGDTALCRCCGQWSDYTILACKSPSPLES